MLNFHEKDTVRDSVEFELAQQLHDRVDEKRHLDIDGKRYNYENSVRMVDVRLNSVILKRHVYCV